ncbi:hypothetical protein, partial [Alkalibacterium sp. s-m-22]
MKLNKIFGEETLGRRVSFLFLYFENPRLCRGLRIAFSVGSKKASLHDKIKLVSRPLTQIIEG